MTQETTQKRFNLLTYLRESKEEFSKVTWPSRKETFRYSLLIIIGCTILAAFIAFLDWTFTLGLNKLIDLAS
ncbi:MAG: Preprotein translocase [Candidatus Uhrbacteria bacterium GW2011_GWF2_41_16]|jgi:preprotein translocase subunit SecE|uniref:Protein translocase subunit SecE n=2 Tax=Candidatus Uhriibacteriota TaxID=1752732 RepID=A0A0G0XPK5_9BACT|nr:MAG: Preprotein translocase [Candidatus Uhrbacteria bacterium GW2011_GWA2_41_10]KKR87796.1 MAG: Preprotein translocase [Candidatus Uhrbacteria bacterium GW2011_GWC2_41_11]KKR98735.1 MAG: Preprotein translocase [Candidatus Uhrbacteria bacterium GW2011_GWF2_41_16]HBP00168.1 preprotein translocase subunit SecE [Candidatus Uhrbacteria bacterium]